LALSRARCSFQSPADLGHAGTDLVGEHVSGRPGQECVVELHEIQACRASHRADALSDHDVECVGRARPQLERRAAP
jgi:hypothetical protein